MFTGFSSAAVAIADQDSFDQSYTLSAGDLQMRDVFQAIDDCFKAADFQELEGVMQATLANFGFDYFTSDVIQAPPNSKSVAPLCGKRPYEWCQRYLSERYYEYDPIAHHVVTDIAPIQWKQVEHSRSLTSQQKRIFDEAKDFGRVDGICLPIWKPNKTIQTVTCISTNSLQLSMMGIAAVRLLALYYVSLGEVLWRPSMLLPQSKPTTPMQRECLKWVRVGKTNWEIGEILNISERTVKFHIKGACERYGVFNRTQAVIEAAIRGDIELS